MARPNVLKPGVLSVAREATALLAIDSATLTDTNIPPAQGLCCLQYDTILVATEIVAGTNPTMTVEALIRDAEAADGARWKRMLLGARPGVTLGAIANETTGALGNNSDLVELRVFGAELVFLRITAVANATSTTAWKILVMGGQPRNSRGAGLFR
jgi:hypothetical protein